MLMRVDPDADLLPGLRAGQNGALKTLMDRRLTAVHRLAFRLLGDPHEAEDVCQEAFLKLWQAAPDWRDGEARLMTWLCRVATHACYDRLRKKSPSLPGELPEPGIAPLAHTAMERAERWDAVQAAMMTLPERQRAAIALRYDQDLPQRDAAAVMEISEKAYEGLLSRARIALKSKLEASHV